jgi:hypothetical protein
MADRTTDAAQAAAAGTTPTATPSAAAGDTTNAPLPGTTPRKVTVNFAPQTYATLETVAKTRNVSMSEALRQAIGLLAFYVDSAKAGDRILIDRKGQINELRIL